MRIKTKEDFENNLDNKIWYVINVPEVKVEDNGLYTPSTLKRIQIVPCTLYKEINKHNGGYRMVNESGKSFECGESIFYVLKGIPTKSFTNKFTKLYYNIKKEQKKITIQGLYEKFTRYIWIPFDNREYTPLYYYKDITMYDGTKYDTYTSNYLIRKEELKDKDNQKEDENNLTHYNNYNYIVFTNFEDCCKWYENFIIEEINKSCYKITNEYQKEIDTYKDVYKVLYNKERDKTQSYTIEK